MTQQVEECKNPFLPNTSEFSKLVVQQHTEAKQINGYNFEGAKIPVISNWNLSYLEQVTKGTSDAKTVQFLKFGWPINIDSNTQLDKVIYKNHRGAVENPAELDKFVEKELKRGTIIGPFASNPFQQQMKVSPINVISKKDSEDKRIIVDLSFPPQNSLNDAIPKDHYLGEEIEFKLPNVDSMVTRVLKLGPNSLIAKRDLSAAYYQIPVDIKEIHYLGFTVRDKIYFFCKLPMGLKSSAFCCQEVTNMLRNIMKKEYNRNILNYLDDLGSCETPENAQRAFSEVATMLKTTGALEAAHKAVAPSTCVTWLGIEIDTASMIMRVPQQKMFEIQEVLAIWESKQYMKRNDLESLIGKLSFAASVVKAGRVMIGRLLNALRNLNRDRSYKVEESVKLDVLWWQKYFPSFNGKALLVEVKWSDPDEMITTDSSLGGAGGVCGDEFFSVTFPKEVLEKNSDINQLELLAIIIGLKIWCHRLTNKKLKIRCDNLVSVTVLNSGRTKDQVLQSYLREIAYLAALHRFEIKAVHLPGSENRLADYLSRLHLGEKYWFQFVNETKDKCMNEVKVKPKCFTLSHPW